MTRKHPHLPEAADSDSEWIDALPERNYAQHVRSIELARGRETPS